MNSVEGKGMCDHKLLAFHCHFFKTYSWAFVFNASKDNSIFSHPMLSSSHYYCLIQRHYEIVLVF